jgi:WD40 repeat protein
MECLQTTHVGTHKLDLLTITPNGKLVIGRTNGDVLFVDLEMGKTFKSFKSRDGRVTSFCVSIDSSILVCGFENGLINFWEIKEKFPKYNKKLKQHTKVVNYIEISQTEYKFWSGSEVKTIRFRS